MRILYLGASTPSSTSSHRANALTRLGHDVKVVDPYEYFGSHLRCRWRGRFHYQTGYRLLQYSITRWIEEVTKDRDGVDCVWVDSGELFGRRALLVMKRLKKRIILFNHDDPTGARDAKRFASLVPALNCFDLLTAVRDETAVELTELGCRNVLRIWRTYDEVAHNGDFLDESYSRGYASDVCFIGTWMAHEGRDKFLLTLAERGLNVSIWGDRWQKSPHWGQLQRYWRGHGLSGKSYVAAIRGAKICLGLLSKGNRDSHTTRSMEIPFAGGLLCAKRTSEHLQLFDENKEAVFWDDADECAEKCRDLLAQPEKRERIRLEGMRRVRKNAVGNENICSQILSKAFE